MRVIAGTARSLHLKAPEGMDTRPTTDRIKETLFNILQPYIPGSVFVDLFSGSGGIGIEALSRGASTAYFVEHAPKAISCIEQNLAFTKCANRGIVIKQDVLAALHSIRAEYVDIVFMDPPYDSGLEKQVLAALSGMPYVTDETMIIVEADLATSFDDAEELGFTVTREKRYKTNKHVFLSKNQHEKRE